MTIDKDGLAAAHEAYERYGQVGDLKSQRLSDGCLSAAIAAYLSALPNTGDELVAKLTEERDSWRRVAERCKSEAEGHAMEARTANSTIYEIYQVLSGAKGEPGNWHGAEPARQYVAKAEASLASAREDALEEAAKVADAAFNDWTTDLGRRIGAAIRALKELR